MDGLFIQSFFSSLLFVNLVPLSPLKFAMTHVTKIL